MSSPGGCHPGRSAPSPYSDATDFKISSTIDGYTTTDGLSSFRLLLNARQLHGCVNRPNLVGGTTMCHIFRVVVAARSAAAVCQVGVLVDVKSVKRRRTTWKPSQVHRDR